MHLKLVKLRANPIYQYGNYQHAHENIQQNTNIYQHSHLFAHGHGEHKNRIFNNQKSNHMRKDKFVANDEQYSFKHGKKRNGKIGGVNMRIL